MDRLLRLSGAGMGGMGSGQGATDAPVVDTAEQVVNNDLRIIFIFIHLGLHFITCSIENVEAR